MGNIASFDDQAQFQLDTLLKEIVAENFTKTNFDRFNEFVARNCYEMAETERVLRLSQSILHLKHDEPLNIQPLHMLFEDFSLTNHRVRPVEGLFDRLTDLIGFNDPENPDVKYQPLETISARNVCLILTIVLDKYQDPKGIRSTSKILAYIAEVLEDENEKLETILWAIVCIERLVEAERQYELSTGKVDFVKDEQNEFSFFKEETKERLIAALIKFASYLDDIEDLYDPLGRLDYLRYQVAFCAKWSLDHVMSPVNPMEPFPVMKISRDRLSVRCDNWRLSIVQSAYPITSGVYYYEVILMTGEVFSIGWASVESHSRDWQKGVGDDAYSIGFNSKATAINRRCIWWDGRVYAVDQLVPDWKPGDVVGCLLDADKQKFTFTLNGNVIKFEVEMQRWNRPIFACASITPHQMCYFNFGQVEFKFAPDDVQFTDMHTETNGDVSKYRLLETALDPTCGRYWFKHQVEASEVSQYFSDQTQQEFDSFIGELATQNPNPAIYNDKLLERFKELIFKNTNNSIFLRLVQSFIECIEVKSSSTENNIPRLFAGLLINLNAINPKLVNPKFTEFLELIHLYMSSYAPAYQQRNLCILLAILTAEYVDNFKVALFDETADFIIRLLSDPNSLKTAKIFAIIFLEGLVAEKTNWKRLKMRKQNASAELLELTKKDMNYYDLNDNVELHLEVQLAFCAKWFVDNYLDSNEAPDQEESLPEREVKTSEDQMTIRNDFGGGSNIRLDSSVDSGVYFYEVVLATGEEMLIGWSMVDKHEETGCMVGYDGYLQLIMHGKEKLPIKESVPRWKAGDVLGCLLDIPNGKFTFYLNGEHKVEYWELQSEGKHYYPAACLSAHQQLRFNHGEVPFKYPPKGVEFRDLRKVLKYDSRASCAIM